MSIIKRKLIHENKRIIIKTEEKSFLFDKADWNLNSFNAHPICKGSYDDCKYFAKYMSKVNID